MKKALCVFIFLTVTSIASWQDDFSKLSSKEKLIQIDKISWDRNGHRMFYAKGAWINCFELLHEFNHSLLSDEVERANGEDIRKKYYDALRAIGLTFSEAKEKAASVIVEN